MSVQTETAPSAANTRRLPVRHRAWSQAQRLLRDNGITQRHIAEEAGLPLASVCRALSLRFFGRTSYAIVIKTRWATEMLLLQHKVAFSDYDLWDEYENELSQP